jgi:hypothetical protein
MVTCYIITTVAAGVGAMARTIEVEIDEAGEIHLVDPSLKLPPGRAILTWPENERIYPALMSEQALADWLRPEEDAAWEHLQQVK